MMASHLFSGRRLVALMWNDIRLNTKTITIAALTIVMGFIFFGDATHFDVHSIPTSWYLLLYLGGFVVSSKAFPELHHPIKACQFLTLPCSNLERFLSKALLTTVGFALGVLILYDVTVLMGMVVKYFKLDESIKLSDIIRQNASLTIVNYLKLQSVFLLGAVFFKRNALLKTCLALALAFWVVFFALVMTHWIAYPIRGHILSDTFKIFSDIWIVLAPLCWGATYFKLTRYELS